MNFRLAKENELDNIIKLYSSAVGNDYCTWNNEYPTMLEARDDFDNRSLYVLTIEDQIIGAISIVPINELDDFEGWNRKDNVREIARVVMASDFQGLGLGKLMVANVLTVLEKNGYKAAHLSVALENKPAYKLYLSLGFVNRGEAFMYGGSYYLLEKEL